jgi:hypothetical protein
MEKNDFFHYIYKQTLKLIKMKNLTLNMVAVVAVARPVGRPAGRGRTMFKVNDI